MEELLMLLLKNGGAGGAIVAGVIVWKIIQNRRNGVSAQQQPPPNYQPAVTPAMGLPQLGGTNPAVGETSNVVSNPLNQPMTHLEHDNVCKKNMAPVEKELIEMNIKLTDTNTQMNKMDTKLEGVQEDVGSIKTSLAVIAAVSKDRENRGS